MQLRDAQTSALVFEGTPYAVSKMWKESPDSFIFDDAPVDFDPEVVLAYYADLEALSGDLKSSRAKGVAEQREAVQNTLDALDPSTE